MLAACGQQQDFSNGKWVEGVSPEFECGQNLQVLLVASDRIQFAALGRVRGDWAGLKTQFQDEGRLIVKGGAGERFRFRDDGGGRVVLEEAPREVSSMINLPREMYRCPDEA